MKLREKVLLLLSRELGTGDCEGGENEWDIDNALSLLKKDIQGFSENILDKNIVDYGCGSGYQSVALAKSGANYVLGIETNPVELKKARDLAETLNLNEKVEFKDKIDESLRSKFDLVISQNSMEHFPDPVRAINQMKYLLNQMGRVIITFGPPWYAPYGSHMQFFTKLPWVNIFFPENIVMNVRSHYRDDGAKRYEEVEKGLNKMTVARMESIISNSGMNIQYRKYECVKGFNILGRLPLLRELFINHISCILTLKHKFSG